MNTTAQATKQSENGTVTGSPGDHPKSSISSLLLLIVAIFSVIKLGDVEMFGRGHFLSPDSVINLLRTTMPIMTVSAAFTLLMISGYIDLSVGGSEPERSGIRLPGPQRFLVSPPHCCSRADSGDLCWDRSTATW
ncbi:MAG: hypothetical protein R2844_09070 [Caldilineales bacterium]